MAQFNEEKMSPTPNMVIQFENGTKIWCYDEPAGQTTQSPMIISNQNQASHQAEQQQVLNSLEPRAEETNPTMIMQLPNGTKIWYMGKPIMHLPNNQPPEQRFNSYEQRSLDDDVITISDEEESQHSFEIRTNWI